jgi:hypothetical protein
VLSGSWCDSTMAEILKTQGNVIIKIWFLLCDDVKFSRNTHKFQHPPFLSVKISSSPLKY